VKEKKLDKRKPLINETYGMIIFI